MISAAAMPFPARSLRRFFKTPKGYLVIVFAVLLPFAVWDGGGGTVVPGLLAATGAAAAVDVVLARLLRREWIVPGGALLTGLIVAMVLSPFEPLAVPAFAAGIGIAAKYAFRARTANLFNPAALGIVTVSLAFGSGQSWWGAIPTLGVPGLLLLLATGIFVADHINKLPLVLAFLGAYFLMFTAASIAGDPGKVAEVFRSPDLQAAMFFAFFMLDDPPTCPARYRDQIPFAILVASVSYAVYMFFGVVYFLPAGLLVGNAWEGWRKMTTLPARPAAATR